MAPPDFGRVGGKLLLSDGRGDNIVAIDADGQYQLFTEIPMQEGQAFLRHMAFSPPEFGALGNLLFVSVAGSERGEGGLGAVHVIDRSGDIVASLSVEDRLQGFDPRGLLFTDDRQLLIADATDVILSATVDDFHFTSSLLPGDADRDFDFDQFDFVRVQQAAKYRTGQDATWGEGDWNGGPGGTFANPPAGDGVFDQLDIVSALQADAYLTGPLCGRECNKWFLCHFGRRAHFGRRPCVAWFGLDRCGRE